MPIKPPRRPKNLLALLLEQLESNLSREMSKRLLNLENQFDLQDWKTALETVDPTKLNSLLEKVSVLGDDESSAFVEMLQNAIRDSARKALIDWSKNKRKLYMPQGRPERVQILNRPSFANVSQTVDLPDWASPTEKIELKIAFDAADKNALEWAKKRAAEMVTAIDDQTRQGIRQVIFESIRDGIDADTTAKRIKNVLGLHPRWASAVTTYEKKQYARLIKEGLSPAKARAKAYELSSKYRDTLVKKRSKMVARTEIMTTSNKGRELGWETLGREGLVDPVAEKEWITAPFGSSYGEPCDTCSSMKGQRVRYNHAFPNGLFSPPAHPHCRCTVKLVPPSRGLGEVQL